MGKTISVDLGERGYEIRIGREVPIGTSVEAGAQRALIVSDSNVDALHGAGCEQQLAQRGFDTTRMVVPAGEQSKSLDCLRTVYDAAATAGLDRSSVIVALGGGMVGDLAGFVAATYMRGIRLIQVPTSLLAMVDSSVGGKTAINLPQGKNLAGVFYQPVEVAADLSTLRTLPRREYISGLGEVVKYGVIWDAELFSQFEKNTKGLLDRDLDLLETIVARCCEIKAEVVAIDEKEAGVRAILNFGHTLAHAIEQVSGYGRWLHGEAVAAGMAFAARVSVLERGFKEDDCERLISLLRQLDLPVRPEAMGAEVEWAKLRAAMSADKKSRHGIPRFVLADRIGAVVFGCEIADETLERALGQGAE